MLLISTAPLPSLVSCTCMGELLVPTFCGGKVSCWGERLTTVPEPKRAMTCGLDEALSEIEIVPPVGPLLCGRKLARIAQFAPDAMLLPQVVRILNSPFTMMDEIDNAVAPALVSMTVCGALMVPISCEGKLSGVVGEKF